MFEMPYFLMLHNMLLRDQVCLVKSKPFHFIFIGGMMILLVMFYLQVLDHLVIQKLNAEGKLEKKETKKGSLFDKVRISVVESQISDDLMLSFVSYDIDGTQIIW